ncbi:DUF6221 family protein [Amycolatopsis pigmentata]|uniref:DUF6221 family protein n=1 Tax=Amycolatopsis pigmentata TaxID=450801 RepID=A0ABW5G314_9PSEU
MDRERAGPAAVMDDLVVFLRERLLNRKTMAVRAKRALDEWQKGNDPEYRWVLDVDGVSVNIKGEYVCVGEDLALFLAFNDPDTMLADVDAKLQVLDDHSTPHTVADGFCVEEGGPCTHAGESHCDWHGTDGCSTVRLLALPFAGHADFRPEWRP